MYVHILWSLFDIDLVNLGKLHRLQGSYFVFADNMSGENINQIVAKKLDKNNFHAWKLSMNNFVMGKVYWEYIEGEHEEAPMILEENTTAARIKDFKYSNQGARKVLHWLSISI